MKRLIIRAALALFLLSCLFPPWVQTYNRNGDRGGHTQKPIGHEFILSPPSAWPADEFHGVKLDFSLLFMEWLAIAAICSASFLPPIKISRKAWKWIGGSIACLLALIGTVAALLANPRLPTVDASAQKNQNPFDAAEYFLTNPFAEFANSPKWKDTTPIKTNIFDFIPEKSP